MNSMFKRKKPDMFEDLKIRKKKTSEHNGLWLAGEEG